MLKKRDRLTAKDIESLSLGKSVFGTLLSFRYVLAPKTGISVTVSKKVASQAILRNRIRRRVYSVLQNIVPKVTTPAKILIMPKKECMNIPLSQISKEIEVLFAKARLLS